MVKNGAIVKGYRYREIGGGNEQTSISYMPYMLDSTPAAMAGDLMAF